MLPNLSNLKQKISRRINSALYGTSFLGRPIFETAKPKYEVNDRVKVSQYGGIPAINSLVKEVGLLDSINESVSLLKRYRPYTEADHVLNIAFSALAGGQNLQDIETLRNDPTYLDSLGVNMIPGATTAGDFCRRFDGKALMNLQDAINETRKTVWSRHAETNSGFFDVAEIDVDGVLVNTTGECKELMDINYKGGWGYHPLLCSLANTGENLFIINRSGNVASHHISSDWIEESVKLCNEAGFKEVRVRGDSDFSLTSYFDKWDEDFKFVFSYDAMQNLKDIAEAIPEAGDHLTQWEELVRKADDEIKRLRPENAKEAMIEVRGYEEMKLVGESIAEFEYQPGKCNQDYRMIVVRKEIEHRRHGELLFPDYRYFFYVTNDWNKTAKEIIKEARQRCNQENTVNQQLQNGVYALKAPLDGLESNGAWMICAGLAWTLKAWVGLLLPVSDRWRHKHQDEQRTILKIEMKKFIREYIQFPVQVVMKARQKILKISAYRNGIPPMMRLMSNLS